MTLICLTTKDSNKGWTVPKVNEEFTTVQNLRPFHIFSQFSMKTCHFDFNRNFVPNSSKRARALIVALVKIQESLLQIRICCRNGFSKRYRIPIWHCFVNSRWQSALSCSTLKRSFKCSVMHHMIWAFMKIWDSFPRILLSDRFRKQRNFGLHNQLWKKICVWSVNGRLAFLEGLLSIA